MKISIPEERTAIVRPQKLPFFLYSGLCQQNQRACPGKGHSLVATANLCVIVTNKLLERKKERTLEGCGWRHYNVGLSMLEEKTTR
jgi:hypothetical protein